MKKIIQVLLISVALAAATPSNTLKAQDVDINVFYNTLTPYGYWVDNASYGRVWICNSAGFVPYETDGHWAYTDYGWTWVSDYDWGWAPFHYGRWAYDGAYGWMWVPGYEWAPAWVSWRSSGDYYGWAPLSPGLSVNVSIGAIPAERWNFVPRRYITSPQVRNYYVNRTQNVTIINKTTVINNTNVYHNTRYVAGPQRTEVEHAVGRPVQPLKVNNASRPGTTNITNNTVNIYRPVIKRDGAAKNNATTNVAPNRPVNTNVITNHPANARPENNRPNNAPVNTNRPANHVNNRPVNTAPVNHETNRPVNNHPATTAPTHTNSNRPVNSQPVHQQPAQQPQPVNRPVQPERQPAQPQQHVQPMQQPRQQNEQHAQPQQPRPQAQPMSRPQQQQQRPQPQPQQQQAQPQRH